MSTLIFAKNAPVLSPPAWTLSIPAKKYHATALAGERISSSMLKEFRLCPAQYHAIVSGKVQKLDSDAFRFGRALHKLILEGENEFTRSFVVGGPVNPRTGKSFGANSKAFDEWLLDNGLDRANIITEAENSDIRFMQQAASEHPEFLRLFSEGWAERSAFASLDDVACQIRIDWLRSDGIAVDVKTIEDISRFEADARRFGYLHQFAFYRDVARAAGGGELEMVAAVLEKKPPYRVGIWKFTAETLEAYSVQNRQGLASLRRCQETGKWLTGYEVPRSFPIAGIPPLWLN